MRKTISVTLPAVTIDVEVVHEFDVNGQTQIEYDFSEESREIISKTFGAELAKVSGLCFNRVSGTICIFPHIIYGTKE